jgi:glycosyltransferase involved in cell wall biosynthesis
VEPLVSILIPAFNAQEFIVETIRSALTQTWPRTEIIIVDDGSTDSTLSIARGFESKNVVVISQQNQGAAAARNRAFSLCQGDYVQWLDADDLLATDKIARQIDALRNYSGERTLLSSAWGHFLCRPRKARFRPSPLWCDLTPLEWLIRKMEYGVHMQTATWLVSRAVTEGAGKWNINLLGDDDGEYFCRVLLESEFVKFVPESKVYYRITGPGSLSYVGQSAKKLEAQYASCVFHLNYIHKMENSERTRLARLKYLQKYALHFSPESPDLSEKLGQLALSFGGVLRAPTVSWKYILIQKIFGLGAAKTFQRIYNQCKSSALKSFDQALFRLEERNHRDARLGAVQGTD